ncbi:ABC transporter ATP-binding protein [Paraclostridium sp. AKS81]|uniref:ABC transporter ATP-binding protein n=1 Tax=Paraclostridium sp. AKS81 TaxID=2876117 RepID=UPI0021DF6EEA|nr:ABC transporter ATP-binding protein [Paraclostridium sp. AKS81]MCU9813240.1 ABC transporter ATP-binding protein/permease [Paraclostridium sp. AKS81]
MQVIKNNTFSNIKEIAFYMPKVFRILYKVNKFYLLTISLLYLMLGFTPSLSILTTQWLINSIQVSNGKAIKFVLIPLVTYISIGFVSSILSDYLNFLQSKFRIKLGYIIQIDILEKTKELEMKDFENPEIYNKLQRVDDSTYEKLFDIYMSIFSLIKQAIIISTAAMILLTWKPWTIVPIIIISIISSLYMIFVGERQYKVNRERASDLRKIWYYKYLLTTDTTYKEIRLYKLEDYFLNLYKKIYERFVCEDIKFVKLNYLGSILFSTLDQIVGGVICLMIITSAFYGEILIGSTISYIRCISTLQSGIQSFLSIIVNVYQDGLYIRHIFEFLDINSKYKQVENLMTINSVDTIEFKNVSFKYPTRNTYTIRNISFKLNRNDKVAIVGLNGSGKTTIVKLLTGFYDEYEGDILINGIELRNIDKDSMRNNMAAIFQDYIKYELSLKENITLGDIENIDDEELIRSILKKIGKGSLEHSLPNSIDTQLGVWFDDGVQLSGGQWQKISLMRAFFRNADCYILDEPNSALDPITENEVFESIYDITKNKIGLLITHRMTNINKFASKILVLKEGELVEFGSHKDLISKNGYYYNLYMTQFKNNKNSEDMEIQYG